MKRLMIQPRLWGSNTGYEWDPFADPAQPHHDYCQLYSVDYSVRLWDPGRNSLSEPGVPGIAGVGNFEAVPLPVSAHIHGIKGEARIRFDGTPEGVGKWLDPATGVPYINQPTANSTYAALAGMPGFVANSIDQFGECDYSSGVHIPLFVALYRGTYKQIDNAAGWEIDSGPGDDPDTLLAMDISSPSVLESSRIDWWDIDWVPAPRLAEVRPLGGGTQQIRGRPDRGSFHKYAVNLSANKRVRSDQVLWLHFKTGVIRLPVVIVPDAGGPEIEVCALYVNHRFSFSIHASMLVDTRINP